MPERRERKLSEIKLTVIGDRPQNEPYLAVEVDGEYVGLLTEAEMLALRDRITEATKRRPRRG